MVPVAIDLDGDALALEQEVDPIGPDLHVARVRLEPVLAHDHQRSPLGFGPGHALTALRLEERAQRSGATSFRVSDEGRGGEVRLAKRPRQVENGQ